jgi:hypothetical protein
VSFSEIEHTDVAAYALGVLNEQDRRAFEAHLSGCRFCTSELADLSGMRALLTSVEPPARTRPNQASQPDRGNVVQMPTRRKAKTKSRNVNQWLMSAAAGLVLVLGGATAGATLFGDADKKIPPIDMKGGKHVSATSVTTGAKGTAVLDDRTWGTWMALEMTNVKGPFNCELIAVAKNGGERVASGWAVPAKGYGVPGSPGHLVVEGGVADEMKDLARLEVRTSTGITLLVIPV